MKSKLLKLSVAVILLAFAAGGSYHLLRHKHSHSPHDQSPIPNPQSAMFYCPMHPTYTSDKPGNCPICGMKLVPAKTKADDRKSMTEVEDRIPIVLDINQQQRIGVKTAVAEKNPLTHVIHASGKVAYDPELYSALSEYQAALSAMERTQNSPWPDVQERSKALVHASALRLKQMGLSQAQINEYTRNPESSINLLLSQGGSVWVYAQVYEYEVGLVKVGQHARISSSAYPGQTFSGIVRSLDPILSSETRSLKIRVEVPNPDGALKLEMYVDASIEVLLGTHVAIPKDAVVSTGRRTLVYVADDNGRFEPREVTLGRSGEGVMEVLSGVSENEKVVVGANFLIDSESKIQASIARSSK